MIARNGLHGQAKNASKGGAWENNATGVEKGKMVYSREGRMCTRILNRICFSRIRPNHDHQKLALNGVIFGSTFAGYACQ